MAETKNFDYVINVSTKGDVKIDNVKKKMQVLDTEVNKLSSNIDKQVDKINKSFERLGKGVFDKFSKDVEKMKAQMAGLKAPSVSGGGGGGGRSTGGSNNNFLSGVGHGAGGILGQAMTNGAGFALGFGAITAIGAATAALVGFGKASLDAYGEYDKYLKILQNGTRDKGVIFAKEAMSDLFKLAKDTPYGLEELTKAYVKLNNRGMRPTMKEMRKMGDIAMASGKNMDQMAEAMLDAQVGQYKRLKEFGFDIRRGQGNQPIKATFQGKNYREFKHGDYNSVMEYLKEMGDVPGVKDITLIQMRTYLGMLEKAKDTLYGIELIIGDNLAPMAKSILATFNAWGNDLIIKDQFSDASKSVLETQNRINALVDDLLATESLEDKKTIVSELKTLYPEYFDYLDAENLSYTRIQESLKGANTELEKKRNLLKENFVTEKLKAKKDELETDMLSIEERTRKFAFEMYEQADTKTAKRLQLAGNTTNTGELLSNLIKISGEAGSQFGDYNPIFKRFFKKYTDLANEKGATAYALGEGKKSGLNNLYGNFGGLAKNNWTMVSGIGLDKQTTKKIPTDDDKDISDDGGDSGLGTNLVKTTADVKNITIKIDKLMQVDEQVISNMGDAKSVEAIMTQLLLNVINDGQQI